MIRSPLRYPGGKSRSVGLIVSNIPPFGEFREPFVGGGSVFIHMKQRYPHRKYWINDLYAPLFQFWNVAKTEKDRMITQITDWRKAYPDGKELHRFLIDNMPRFDHLKTAAAFFVFNRITFSGTAESGGFSQAAFEKRFTVSSIERLFQLDKVLADTRITNVDYQEVVEQSGEQVFLFLDPPYYSATPSALYGKNGHLHKGFDHERFAQVMKKCKHNWLITYDDSPYIRELFSFAHIQPWTLTYGMRNQTPTSVQKGLELFISNYPLPTLHHGI